MVLILIEGAWRSIHELESWQVEFDWYGSLGMHGDATTASVHITCRCGYVDSEGRQTVLARDGSEDAMRAAGAFKFHAGQVGELWFLS